MAKVKKGDLVQIMTGSREARNGSRGKQGRVLAVVGDRVWVEGVNFATKHVRQTTNSRGSRSGGVEKREAPVHISNVAVVDPESKTPTKVGYRLETAVRGGVRKTVRIRYSKKSGKELA